MGNINVPIGSASYIKGNQTSGTQITLQDSRGSNARIDLNDYIFLNQQSELVLDSPSSAVYDKTNYVEMYNSSPNNILGTEANQRQIVQDLSGNIISVQCVTISGQFTVFVRKYTPSLNTFSTIGQFTASGIITQISSPSIAIDKNGDLHLIVLANSSTYPNGSQAYIKCTSGVWGSWMLISSPGGSYSQSLGSIAVDSNNLPHVVWFGSSASNPSNQIKYSKFNGTSWSSWVDIGYVAGGKEQYSPSISIDSNNNIMVAWSGYDTVNPSHVQVKWVRFNGTSWSAWTNLSVTAGYPQNTPSLLVDSANTFHLCFSNYRADYSNKYNIVYTKFNGTSWSSLQLVSPSNTWTRTEPSIGIDNSGNIFVACQGYITGYTTYEQAIWSKFNGSTWGDWSKYTSPTTNNHITMVKLPVFLLGTADIMPCKFTIQGAYQIIFAGKWTVSNSPQLIPAVTTATSATQLQALGAGTLKSSGSVPKKYNGFKSKTNLGYAPL